jgi:hypothetical protein
MTVSPRIGLTLTSLLGAAALATTLLAAGCVVEPRGGAEPHEGYYDRDNHRWWHEHTWHECREAEEHCRG